MSFQPAPPVRPWRALSDGCRVVELDLDLDLDPPRLRWPPAGEGAGAAEERRREATGQGGQGSQQFATIHGICRNSSLLIRETKTPLPRVLWGRDCAGKMVKEVKTK